MRNGEKWEPRVPFKDNRNWHKYNEELTVMGEFLLDLDWVKSWDEELERMNEKKRGHPFEFPESLIQLQAVWNQWIGLRQVEGITRKLVELARLPDFDDYSTVNRRIRKLDTSIELPKRGFVSVSTDGTGMKMHHAGEYRQEKYGSKKRRWIRVVISANPLTKELLFADADLDGEGDSEPNIATTHLNELWSRNYTVDKFWGDGAFDVIDLFNILEEHGTESAIPIRKNAAKNSHGSMRRLVETFEFQTKSWNDWTLEKSYGLRWLGTECIHSAVKGIFGEHTKAKTPKNACKEAKRKYWAYSRMKNYARSTS